MKDIQGIQRGACNKCECEEYRWWCPPADSSAGEGARLRCEYCNHTPVEHVRIIPLGACKKCGEDCEKYESETPNKYTDCQYCGCGAQHHQGAEKLIKKSASEFNDPTGTGMAVRMDTSGKPAQTSQFGTCKCHGCNFPRRIENGHVHDFCSRTCARKHEQMTPSNFPGGCQMSPQDVQIMPAEALAGMNFMSGVATTSTTTVPLPSRMCTICNKNAANPGYDWCQRCYAMAQSQKHHKTNN